MVHIEISQTISWQLTYLVIWAKNCMMTKGWQLHIDWLIDWLIDWEVKYSKYDGTYGDAFCTYVIDIWHTGMLQKVGPWVVCNWVKKLHCFVYLLQAGKHNFFTSFSHNLGPTFGATLYLSPEQKVEWLQRSTLCTELIVWEVTCIVKKKITKS